jgi:DNA-binding beta-propeller fold protein YncE
MLTAPFGPESALVGSAPVGNGPDFSAIDPATHTLYVTNGFNEIGNPAGGNTVSVIDTSHCHAQDVSRCAGPWPTITVGNMPSSVAVNEQTDTVYVSNAGDNSVSVFNGAICNAENSSGCGQTPATVPVGMVPVAIFVDPVDHTVYIPNGGEDDVSMLDSATCNATDLATCPATPPPTVTLPGLATAGDVDQATHTAYVTICANNPFFGCGPGTDGVAVFDTSTCNAAAQAGCDQLGALPDGNRPLIGDAVDAANHTLYTANGDNTVSAFDLRRCNASDLAACATDTPGVLSFPGPQPGFDVSLWVVVDAPQRSVYVTRAKDDSVVVVDTGICNGSNPAGCATLHPPVIHAGSEPEILSLDPATQTLYTVNQLDNDVSVIDATRCNADTTAGCRHLPPEVPISASGLAADPGVATIYGPGGADTVSLINATQCNASHNGGCSQTPPTATVGAFPKAVAVDPVTHTVYIADGGSGSTGTVSVFDDRTCNATHQAGCGAVSTLQVPGGNPDDIAVNTQTDTVYVATITSSGPDLLSVFNGATCDATSTADCSQTPVTVAVGSSGDAPGNSSLNIAVNPETNTIYAANVYNTAPFEPPPYLGNTVYVINGAICDAANTKGCGQTPATVTIAANPPIGSNPAAIAVDQATDTIYTANIADGENPGTVSVINGATCNSQNTSGCDQTPATAPAGFGTNGIAIDPTTNHIYATNIEDTSVTTINGNNCNGSNAAGCDHARTQATVGDYPGPIALDPHAGTAYVQAFEGISVIPLTP